MNTTTLSDFQRNLKTYFDRATDEHEPTMIIRKGNRNAVLVSAKEYNNLLENQFVMGNPTNIAYLRQSKAQLEADNGQKHDILS